MQITSVCIKENRCFIPVKGWQGVIDALTLFANGQPKGAKATQQHHVNDIMETNDLLAAGLVAMAQAKIGKRSNLVDRLLLEAGQTLERRSQFHKSYDYDGMGTVFFKTSVEIRKLGDDMYGIGLSAAYVGDQPEVGLAEFLDTPRALLWCEVEVEVKPAANDRFEFDFEPVLRKLDSVIDIKKITGEQVATAMLQKDEYGARAVFVLGEHDGLRICIQPGRVECRMKYDHETRKEYDTWSIKGSVFSGELAQDFESKDEDVKATPTFEIVVSPADRRSSDFGDRETPIIWQLEEQQKMIDLANRIAAALK